MKKKIINSVLCVAFVFLCGVLATFPVKEEKNKTTKAENSVDIYRPQPTELTPPIITPPPAAAYYLLKNEENTLLLYEILGEDRDIIKKISINTDILPHEDLVKLRQGIKLTTAEEAYSLIEDFSS
ncbi:MAG: hypothetical protein IJD30_06030 [Clostridia bacterium]|nr:hypothetical protein [Clostridia bacterium]